MTGISPHVGHERDVEPEAWEGIVTWKTLVSADRTPSAAMTVGLAEIAPDASDHGARHHHAEHEVYYFLAGTGQVHLGGDEHDVEPGSVVFVPGGTAHFVRNTGRSTLRFLYAFAVDRFTEVEYRFDDAP